VSSSSKWNLIAEEEDKDKRTTQQQELLDDIETQQYGETHRFANYRHAKCKKTTSAVGLTCEDVYYTITHFIINSQNLSLLLWYMICFYFVYFAILRRLQTLLKE